jgi:serine/threonine-protein kinase
MASNNTTYLYEKFEIIDCLKKDAYTGVYLANHVFLGKKIILKTLDAENLPDKTILKRFKREAKILAKLDHPNIIKVLDFGTWGKDFYISFEYFDGLNLRQTIQKKKLDETQKIYLLRQLFRGLEYAHRNHIIHRDIKPENILVNPQNQLKIADFGLALILNEDQITQKTSVVGTPGYMSPEQIRGEALSAQSDLFSAGILAWELFSEKNPFLGKDAGETINNILKRDAVRLAGETDGIPAAIGPVIQHTLPRERPQRIKSAGEILDLLPAESQESSPLPGTPASKGKKLNRRRVLLFLFLGMLLTVATATFIVRNPQSDSAPKPLQPTFSSDSAAGQPAVMPDTFIAYTDNNPRLSEQFTPENKTKETPLEKAEEVSRENLAGSLPVDIEKIPEETALAGELLIHCLPWADVYVNGNKIDTTPLKEAILLQAGGYTLKLSHPQYPAYSREITILPEKQLNISVDLDTLFGYMDCKIYPWGEIQVDGETKGQTPLNSPIILTPGRHLLTIVNPQYDKFEETINIIRGDTFQYKLNFESLDNN